MPRDKNYLNVNYFNNNKSFSPILRQTPNNDGIFGNIKFSTNNLDAEWQIIDSHTKTIEEIFDKKIVYLIVEPEVYMQPNLSMINKSNIVISPYKINTEISEFITSTVLQWTYGISIQFVENVGHVFDQKTFLSFDQLVNMPIPKKEKLCSMILSIKTFLPGHKKRILFADKISKHFKNKIDIFGFGHNPIKDKRDAIDPYKFSIAIENSSSENYWTEKISDVFLGSAFPIYYGCKNIDSYFNKDSYRVINIDNIDESIETIEDLFKNSESIDYRKILDSRNKVLKNYNMFKVLHDIINKVANNKY